MVPQWIIEKKRDGHALTCDEITAFIVGYTDGTVPDYQMSALAMAIFFQGMSPEETSCLTNAMMNSGEILQLKSLTRPTCDKHSTGGIGDKVSLILAPLAAACGLAVPMISGRGLGITGGTLDKFESIPGYRTDLSPAEFEQVISQCGCSIIGQTADLAPADKKLYALRDVTGTVPSIPLISASIMSKKLAEGAASLVLDVKWGSGAFMETADKARELASTMIAIGERMGRNVSALITDMNQPLGCTVGNAIEVVESIQTLQGRGPADLTTLTVELCAEMLCLSGLSKSTEEACELARNKLADGTAFTIFRHMVELQGGDTRTIDNPALLPQAIHTANILSPCDGYVASMSAREIGKIALLLGAGRKQVTDTIDHSAGVSQIAKVGSKVRKGDIMMSLLANDRDKLDAARSPDESAFTISDSQPQIPQMITERIRAGGQK